MAAWKARAGLNKPAPVQTEAPRASVEQPRRRPQPHKQIARRHWNVSSRYYDVRAAAERAGLTRIAPPAAAPSGWTVRHEGRRTPTRYTGHAGDQEARTGGLAGGDLHVDAEG